MFKHLIASLFIICVTVVAITVTTSAAFTATATLSGINFSTGHAALKLFGNLGYTNAGNNGNLTTTLQASSFDNIGPYWSRNHLLKYFNTGSVNLQTQLRAVITSDPSGLQDQVQVEVWLWSDVNQNGQADGPDTLTLISPAQTLKSLSLTPVALGQLNTGTPRGLKLVFKTADLPSSFQNQQSQFNFVIEGTTDGVTP